MKKLLVIAFIVPLTFASDQNTYPVQSFYQSIDETPEQTSCCFACLNAWIQLTKKNRSPQFELESTTQQRSEPLLPEQSVRYSAIYEKPKPLCIIL